MLNKVIIIHEWKSFIANKQWKRNVLGKIFMGVITFCFVILFLSLGFYIDVILKSIGLNEIYVFNSYLLWYILLDLLFRCFLQPLPTINVLPYIRFKIRRKEIISYILFRSFFNPFNLLPWLVLLPFSEKFIRPAFGNLFTVYYLIGILLILILNNYLASIIKFLGKINVQYYILPIGIIGIYILFERTSFKTYNISTSLGQTLLQGNIALFSLLVISILTARSFIRRLLDLNFYIDIFQTKKTSIAFSGIKGMDVQGNFGEIIRYIFLEIALILRNKRPLQLFAFWPIYFFSFLYMA